MVEKPSAVRAAWRRTYGLYFLGVLAAQFAFSIASAFVPGGERVLATIGGVLLFAWLIWLVCFVWVLISIWISPKSSG